MKKRGNAADVLYNVLRISLIGLIVFNIVSAYVDNADPATVVLYADDVFSKPQTTASEPPEESVISEPESEADKQETAVGDTQAEEPVESVSEPAVISAVVQSEQNYAQAESTDGNISGEPDGGLININTASAERLTSLNGIGEVKAAAIVEYRRTHGGFSSVDELLNVKGIGEKTLEKIRSRVTV